MLNTLELINIRSYKNGLFEFSEGVNIVVGPNASGKTNLLEAIHMAYQGGAFKSDDQSMIKYSEPWGRIEATLGEDSRVVKLTAEPKSKTFVINDTEKKRLPNNSVLPVVLFEPSHMLLLGGEPERRRAYLDGILSQIDPSFRQDLTSYKRTLLQRNRLLKQEGTSQDHMFVWDVRLSELGGSVVERRTKYINVLNESITKKYQSVSGNKENLELLYDTKLNAKQYTTSYISKLKSDYELDRLRGYTGSGPHREDIKIMLDSKDARASASRGETRSIVLSLKMTELDTVTEFLDKKPLLLLDDVFSELDGRRRRMLAQALKNHQTLITTTDADAIVKNFLEDYNVITTSS